MKLLLAMRDEILRRQKAPSLSGPLPVVTHTLTRRLQVCGINGSPRLGLYPQFALADQTIRRRVGTYAEFLPLNNQVHC